MSSEKKNIYQQFDLSKLGRLTLDFKCSDVFSFPDFLTILGFKKTVFIQNLSQLKQLNSLTSLLSILPICFRIENKVSTPNFFTFIDEKIPIYSDLQAYPRGQSN
jgi:hypothetical protein